MRPSILFFDELIEHYRTTPGFCFHTTRDPREAVTSGNHHVINAVAHKILKQLDALPLEWMTMRRGAVEFIEACRDPGTGEFNRAPTKEQDQSHDDLVAICSTAVNLDARHYAGEIVWQGRKKMVPVKLLGIRFKIPLTWYFDNTESSTEFEFSNWLGRFGWFQAFVKICWNVKPSLLERAALTLYFLAGVMETDRTAISGRQLRWLMTDIIWEKKYPIVNWAVKLWLKDQMKMYPEGWGEALGIYHKPEGDKAHPFETFGSLAFENEIRKNLGHGVNS